MNIADIPEDLAKAIWWILQRIKKEDLATPSGEQIYFKFVFGEVIIMGRPKTIPYFENQDLALKVLEKERAIKIHEYIHISRANEKYRDPRPTGAKMYVLQPKFDKLYKECQKAFTATQTYKQPAQLSSYVPVPQTEQPNVKRSSEEVITNEINKIPISPSLSSQSVDWSDDFVWQGDTFIFGKFGSIDFSSKDRKVLFKKLTDAKGQWIKVNDLKGDKDASYVRATIKQIEDRLEPELKTLICIPSTQDDDLVRLPQ